MDLAPLAAVIVAVLGAGGLGALLQARSLGRRTTAEAAKADAEAQVTLGDGWATLYAAQQSQITNLAERVKVVEHRAQTAEDREAECLRRLDEFEGRARSSLAAVETKVLALLDKEIAARGVP